MMEERRTKFKQDSQFMTFGQSKFSRTNIFDARCSEPIVSGNIISVPYTIHWYGAGAAHPSTYFRTYAFFLDPVVHIESLRQIFSDEDGALKIIQSVVREQLLAPTSTPEEPSFSRDMEWVERGTEDWQSFQAFVFKERELELLIAPYQVDCYAAGQQFASVNYERVATLMHKEYADALGI
jgi:hypothetical protein